jgi:hypothetical protein
VHRVLGPGFLESAYEEALCIELTRIGVRFARQVPISIRYKDQAVGEARLDLLSYLKATDLGLGLLITFNVPLLPQGIRRVVRTC